jgi:O-acetyl-ADP-ribose deacetylase
VANVIRQYKFLNGAEMQLVQGDITAEGVDAIVNAANSRLQHGGGVAGAISRNGGPSVQKESNDWLRMHGPVSHDRPAYTGGGNLPCRYIIHAVGPVWGEGDEDAKLAAAVAGSLAVADELGVKTLSLPAISTGIFGFPKERAARIIYQTIQEYLLLHPSGSLAQVRLVLYDQPTLDVFLQVWDDLLPETSQQG